jgi:hypothetical protein
MIEATKERTLEFKRRLREVGSWPFCRPNKKGQSRVIAVDPANG